MVDNRRCRGDGVMHEAYLHLLRQFWEFDCLDGLPFRAVAGGIRRDVTSTPYQLHPLEI